jgi:hypothetical protein
VGQRFPVAVTTIGCPHLGHGPLATDHCKIMPKLTKATQLGIIPHSQGRGTCGMMIKTTAIAKVVIVPQATPPKIRIAEVKDSGSVEVVVSFWEFGIGEAIGIRLIVSLSHRKHA